MTWRRRILGVVAVLLVVCVLAVAFTFSHNSACGEAPVLAGNAPLIKAIVHRCYGPPEVLRLEEIEKPTPADDEVLVRVQAASANPLDWHYMRGTPYVMRLDAGLGAPKSARLGVDFAGKVEAVGKDVKRFKPGDEVFGGRTGAFGEYVTVREERAVVIKPAAVTFEQAAAVPIAALTALQGLRDKGHLQAGQKVLINGASGGVGTFAVQLAKALGAEVTGVCSTRNVDLVRSIGADHVIDYTQENFTEGGPRFDLVLDMVGNHSLLDVTRALKPDGTLVIVGGSNEGVWVGPMARPLMAFVLSPFVSQQLAFLLADLNKEDLQVVSDMMQDGRVTAVIDRRYRLSEVPEAIRYLEEGHARGKVVINLESTE